MTSADATITLGELQDRCDEILGHLAPSGVVVTKEGQPVARITPLATVNNEPLIGSMKGQIAITGDLWSAESDWNAQP